MTKTNEARRYLYDLTERMEQAPEGSIPAALAATFFHEVMEVQGIESEMRSELATIADRAERARKALDDGMNLKSLGEFHTSPARFDQLCARRSDAWSGIVRLVSVLNGAGMDIDMDRLREAIVARMGA